MKQKVPVYRKSPIVGDVKPWVESELFAIERVLTEIVDRLPLRGNGSPEGVVTANRGTLYLRTDGGATTTLYVKTANDGANTGWTAK